MMILAKEKYVLDSSKKKIVLSNEDVWSNRKEIARN